MMHNNDTNLVNREEGSEPIGVPVDSIDRVLHLAINDNVSVCWGGVLSQKPGDSLYGFCVSDFCLFFVSKGTLRIKVDDNPFVITKGQTVLIWPDEKFAGAGPCQDHLSCQWLSFRINRPRPRKQQEIIEVPRVAKVSDSDRIAELFRMITDDYHAANNPPQDDWVPLSDYGSRLLLLSLMSRLKTESPAAQSDASALTILAERGRDYIRMNSHKPISTADVAKALDCSTRYLRKAFQHSYNYSPSSYILFTRLVSARHYLAETRTPISQVARQCGFESHDYFTRVFRLNEGVTPSRYRLAHSRKYTVPDI